jgi:hypothetical protein
MYATYSFLQDKENHKDCILIGMIRAREPYMHPKSEKNKAWDLVLADCLHYKKAGEQVLKTGLARKTITNRFDE